MRARLQLLVNSQTHSPVAVYCGGKPCQRRPKNTNSTVGSFTFSTETHTHVRTHVRTGVQPPPPPSPFLRAALRPAAILQGSGWISGAEQLQIGISCARLAESLGRKKKKEREVNPLVGSPAGTGGVRASSSSGQTQQTKEAFPSSPRQPVPLFDNGCHGGSFSIHNSINTSGWSGE